MFSALKRLTGRGDAPETGGVSHPGLQTMSANLQRKFARGVHYNMKIVIKGDRNVGKTCLFYRLQGKKFVESYIPTEEIQVASIHWNYKTTDDIVKVEVWDVVDKGKKKKAFDGLKLDNSHLEIPEEAALDAEFLDVYKNANGVILVMDITKSWTFNYIQRELPKIPEHIPIIILANHCDMAHHRTVTPHHLSFYVENLQRRPDAAQVRYCESSMRNGFGLKMLHKFFNLPFLHLQRDTLLKQLETNRSEIELTIDELDLYMESEDADYNIFLEKLVQKRRVVADSSKPVQFQNSQSVHQLHQPASNLNLSSVEPPLKRSVSFNESYKIGPIGPIGGGHPISSGLHKTAIGVGNPHFKALGPSFNMSDYISRSPGEAKCDQMTDNSLSCAVPEPNLAKGGGSGGFMSKLFGKTKETSPETNNAKSSSKIESISTVDEFVADDGTIDRSFLEDIGQEAIVANTEVESDSEGEFGNPLVSGFQDDLDSDDVAVNSSSSFRNGSSGNDNKTYNHSNHNNNDNDNDTNRSKYSHNPKSDYHLNEIGAKLNSMVVSSTVASLGPRDSEERVSVVGGEERGSIVGEENEVESPAKNFQTYDITGEALDTWLSCDSKWRRSPEGGEDSQSECQKARDDADSMDSLNLSSSLLDVSSTKKEKKKKKDKEMESKLQKTRKKSSERPKDKTKEKNNLEKKKKKINRTDETELKERDELEEFLNGPSAAAVDASYEAF